MSLKSLSILFLLIIILSSCAKPNEPAGTEGVFTIEKELLTGGYARDIAVSDDVIFVAEDQQGFSIYNYISGTRLCHRDTLNNRYLENTFHLTGSIANDILFVYDTYGTNGINVFDISNLQNPAYLTVISGDTDGVEKLKMKPNLTSGTDLFWTKGNKLKTGTFDSFWTSGIDVEFPKDVAGFDLNEEIFAVAAHQHGIYIVSRTSGIILSTIETTGDALDVKIVDNYIIAALREEGFTIFDISDQSNPVHVITEDVGELIYTVDAEDDNLVLSSRSGGVILYDISEISDIQFVGSIDSNVIGYTFEAEIHNGKIFASTRTGVYIISIKE